MSYSFNEYHELRNKIWDDLVSTGVTSDEDENFIAFDTILGNHLEIDLNSQDSDEVKEISNELNRAGEILSGYDTPEELQTMINKIYEHALTGLETDLIDYVDGVTVWEKLELEFTCKEFIEYIKVIE